VIIDAQKDLALNPEDAESVVGGKLTRETKKHAVSHAAHAGGRAIIINEPPLAGGPQDPSLEPAQGDDPDC